MGNSNLVCYCDYRLHGRWSFAGMDIRFATVSKVYIYSFFIRYTFSLTSRSFVMAAAMFMNSNALPIALMQSLVVSVPDLAWGSDDNKNAMLGRALTYLTMYSTLGMVVRCLLLTLFPLPLH